jgi:hypothetical protein
MTWDKYPERIRDWYKIPFDALILEGDCYAIDWREIEEDFRLSRCTDSVGYTPITYDRQGNFPVYRRRRITNLGNILQ